MPSTNTFNKANWVTMDGLDLLLNDLALGRYYNTDDAAEYRKPYAVGATVTKPLPQRYIPRTSLTYTPQSLNRPTTTITVDQIRGVDLEYDSIEQALDMERGEARVREIYLKPAIAQLRQEIDSYLALFAYQNTNMIAGALGTNPTTVDGTSAAALEALIEMGCPVEDVDVGLFVPPAVTRAVKNSQIGYFNPSSDVSKQNRTGFMGKTDSLDWYNSMSLYAHTAGTVASTYTVNTASGSVDNLSTLRVNCTNGDTWKKGDILKINAVNAVNLMTRRIISGVAKTFVVTQDITATSTTADLPIYPSIKGPGNQYQNVDALPVTSATITSFPGTGAPGGKSGINGLALYKDAFMLVGVNLELPEAVEVKSQNRDDETGIALRFIRQWDNIQSRMTNRYDTLFGCGVGLAEQCAVRILCA